MTSKATCLTQKPLNFERIPEQEEAWRKEITALTIQLQDKRKALQDGEILRGVHPKSHGCLDARFRINNDVPEDLQIGLFSNVGHCFKAKIRYSNADVLKRADIEATDEPDGTKIMKHGSRGMAIKVLDVEGPVLLDDGCDKNQDFLMVNTPEFAFRNVRDYRRLTAALVASEDGATPDLFFLPGKMIELGIMDMEGNLAPVSSADTEQITRMRAIFTQLDTVFADYTVDDVQGVISASRVVRKIQATSVRNPLNAAYFSAAPFRFGPDRVMRYMVEPSGCAEPDTDLDPSEMRAMPPDYLAQALATAIAEKTFPPLSFKIQVASAADIEGREDQMIENASQPWNTDAFEPVEVAQLEISPDQPCELVDACKPRLFTPWHALADHEPLGGINRLRKPVYSASADFRRN
jgi:hypothetical protein